MESIPFEQKVHWLLDVKKHLIIEINKLEIEQINKNIKFRLFENYWQRLFNNEIKSKEMFTLFKNNIINCYVEPTTIICESMDEYISSINSFVGKIVILNKNTELYALKSELKVLKTELREEKASGDELKETLYVLEEEAKEFNEEISELKKTIVNLKQDVVDLNYLLIANLSNGANGERKDIEPHRETFKKRKKRL